MDRNKINGLIGMYMWHANPRNLSYMEVEGLPDEYPAYFITIAHGELGVAIPYEGEIVAEDFVSVGMRRVDNSFHAGESHYLLVLSSTDRDVYTSSVFFSICLNFIDPGENGNARYSLVSNPVSWWRSWRDIMGNSISHNLPYTVLGELLVYLYLQRKGLSPIWKGPESGSHDIVTKNEAHEVKSTLNKYDKRIHIAGQHQLKHSPGEVLYLYYCQFEDDPNGKSIDDVVNELVSLGCNLNELNLKLAKLGYKNGGSSRKAKYSLHGICRYEVDDSFPKINEDSFIQGKLPEGVLKLEYDVDLSNLPSISITL